MTNTNTRHTALTGYDVDYSAKEARIALAIADASGNGNSSTDVTAIENALGTTADVLTDPTVIGLLKAISDKSGAPAQANQLDNGSFTSTATSSVLLAADAARATLNIQNKSATDIMYVGLGSPITVQSSITLLPHSVVAFTGLEAQSQISTLGETASVAGFYWSTSIV